MAIYNPLPESPVRMIRESEWLRTLIADLTDELSCTYDHHGYCQEHAWLTDESPCPHSVAKRLLAAAKGD